MAETFARELAASLTGRHVMPDANLIAEGGVDWAYGDTPESPEAPELPLQIRAGADLQRQFGRRRAHRARPVTPCRGNRPARLDP